MKITVSGWVSTGTTTLAILLADILKLKLIQGGEVFRTIYKAMESEVTGIDRTRIHNLVEPYFGPLFDEYIDVILKNKDIDNIIVESDIASFRIGKRRDITSIFLLANKTERIKRTNIDNRSEDGVYLDQIDAAHVDAYKKLHNIEFMDLQQINEKHALVIENSNVSIWQELKQVLNHINYDVNNDILKDIEKKFWEIGKDAYKNLLRKQNLIPDPIKTLKEILKNKDITTFPEKIQSVLNNLVKQ